jgi:hypothetical protein
MQQEVKIMSDSQKSGFVAGGRRPLHRSAPSEQHLRSDALLGHLAGTNETACPPDLTDIVMHSVASIKGSLHHSQNRSLPVTSGVAAGANSSASSMLKSTKKQEITTIENRAGRNTQKKLGSREANTAPESEYGRVAIAWAFFVGGAVAGIVLTLLLQEFNLQIPGVPTIWIGAAIQLIMVVVLYTQMDVLARYTRQVFMFRKRRSDEGR